ncbi:MAG: hypothetical protein ACHQQQ_04740 [Bacteroidota bacterium]
MNHCVRCSVVLFFYLILCAAVEAQNVTTTDYQPAISSAKQLRVDANWNWSQAGNIPTGNSFYSFLTLNKFYSSLPFAWFLNAYGSTYKILDSNWLYSSHIDGEVRKYIWDDMDWFGSSTITFEKNNGDIQPEVSARVAAGYGRYIDATALAKAVRIEDHLLTEKVIKDFLPKESMIKIANIIERQDEYNNLYGTTYEVQWFADIEKEIKSSGLLVGENLGAIGLYRIRQVLLPLQNTEIVNSRFYGWDLSAGVEYAFMNRMDTTESPNLSLAGHYAYPIDWSMQARASVKVNSPMDSSFTKSVVVVGEADYLYELSSRINFTTSYILTYWKSPNGDATRTHQAVASFLFYIENNIYYNLSASLTRVGANPAVQSINMGLQYNLFH